MSKTTSSLASGSSATAVSSRLFTVDDLRALYAVEEVCFEPTVRFSRSLMRSLVADEACRTWLGIVAGVRVGFAIVGLRGEGGAECTAGVAYIWTIEVLPGFRRMGVARQLLGRVEESAREAGCTAVELHVAVENLDAVALYEAAGFVRVGVEAGFYGPGADGLRYSKRLI